MGETRRRTEEERRRRSLREVIGRRCGCGWSGSCRSWCSVVAFGSICISSLVGELGPARDGEGGEDLVGMGGRGAVTGRESARSRSVAKTSSTGRRVQIGELSSM